MVKLSDIISDEDKPLSELSDAERKAFGRKMRKIFDTTFTGRAHAMKAFETEALSKSTLTTESFLVGQHRADSAAALLRQLEDHYQAWSEAVGVEARITGFAVLQSGTVVRICRLFQSGQNGISVDGELNGLPCMFFVHQAALQILYTVEPAEKEEEKSNPIGFVYQNK